MPVPNFSINGAAELLERDRRTITKALRHVLPDGHVNKSPRWRLRTIIDALETAAAHSDHYAMKSTTLADQADALFKEFDTAFERVKSAPSLAERRKMAIALYPLIEQAIDAMRARDTADGLNADHVSLRSDRVFNLLLIGFEGPCKWTRDEVWAHLIPDDEDN